MLLFDNVTTQQCVDIVEESILILSVAWSEVVDVRRNGGWR